MSIETIEIAKKAFNYTYFLMQDIKKSEELFIGCMTIVYFR